MLYVSSLPDGLLAFSPVSSLETNANGEILVSSLVSAPDYCHQTGQEDDQPHRQGHRHHRRRPQGPARLQGLMMRKDDEQKRKKEREEELQKFNKMIENSFKI